MTDSDEEPVGERPFDDASGAAVPDVVAARDSVVDELVQFCHALRGAGADVPANASLTGARALVTVGFDRDRAKTALRAALLTRQEDIETYDRLFESFWRRLRTGLEGAVQKSSAGESDQEGIASANDDQPDVVMAGPPGGDDHLGEVPPLEEIDPREASIADPPAGPDEHNGEADSVRRSVYSRSGSPGLVEADAIYPANTSLEGAMRELTGALAMLRGRRFSRGGDGPVDARRALRESVGTGGTVLRVPRTVRDPGSVRATLLVDVSQSVLDVLDEGILVEFCRLARTTWRNATVFFFDESIREVSEAFDGQTVADALGALERAEAEWGGGTRIGEAVETVRRDFNQTVDRDTVIFVVSDGLEVGDLDDLARGMAWLTRRAAGVLWLNPLAAAPGYEPTARGMATALPYVDGLFAFAGADDLAEVARQLRLRGVGGRIGYRHERRQEPT